MSLALPPERAAAPHDAIMARLERLHPKRIDLSLGRIERLLHCLGHPERALPPVVHIAGTNGKGSVLAYMRAGLEAAGYRVHVYTSPHLVRFNERIRISGSLITDEALSDALDRTERANDGAPITFFEITTAAAFIAFVDNPADILLLETGLGGRLDATNVVDRPLLTAITPISRDHEQFLGETLRSIATEKAGILKTGVPVMIAPQPADVLATIREAATARGAPLQRAGPDWSAASDGDWLRYASRRGARRLPLPALPGVHQIDNAGVAVACLEALADFQLDDAAYAAAMRHVAWPGRLQRLDIAVLAPAAPAGTELWLDGGHNEAAGHALADSLHRWDEDDSVRRSLHLVFAMQTTKDPTAFLAPFRRLRPSVTAVPIPGNAAALSPEELASAARSLAMPAAEATSVRQAVQRIVQENAAAGMPLRILICGSLYLAGTVLADVSTDG